MADMQKRRDVLQGMAICDGELNKLRAKVPYQRGRGTCNKHGSLIRLMLLTKQPVQQKGQPLFSLDLAVVSVSLKVATDSQEKCFHYIAN